MASTYAIQVKPTILTFVYINTLMFFVRLTGLTPDIDKVGRTIKRTMRVKFVKIK